MTRRFVWFIVMFGLAIGGWSAGSRARANEIDHLLCYRMRDPLSVEAKFDLLAKLQPEFSRRGCKLAIDEHEGEAQSEFCVPASKVNVEAEEHNGDLGGPPLQMDYICYRIECERGARPPDKFIEDQFGRRAARFGKSQRICVPARKEPVPCGPTGSATSAQCGGECPQDDQHCRHDRATGECTCAPRECGGRLDAAGMCGGSCPDPTQQCAPNAHNRCVCNPRGCGLDPAGNQCSGECPVPGEICVRDAAGACDCAPPPMCAPDANGMCGGPCPTAGDVCLPDPTSPNADCRCQPPPPRCALDPVSGQCGGPCPVAGDVCLPDPVGPNGDCRCQPPPPPTCGLDPLSGQCGGTCSGANEACLPVASGVCDCVGTSSRCSRDPSSGQCGGFCSPGSTCELVTIPGTNLEECRCL